MPSAVISGASIAGLSAAFWLRRTGWDVTVIERAPAFRDGGQNVDVRGVAREVLRRMGLFDAIKAQNTTETGTVLVDASGRVRAELPSEGPDAATAELEVLRGDFARTILDHLPDGVAMLYGDTIDEVTGDTVTTVAGRTLPADLVVIAEGVRSATRDRLFGPEVDRHELGITMVFGTIPRTPADDDRWRWYNTVGGRQIHLRPDNHGTTRAILSYARSEDLTGLDRPEALARVRERYADAGWEAPRILDAFDTSDDVYIDHLTQIRMSTWHRGRVVLAGDAAWCVTPMGGGGASLALISGYVLAAYLTTEEPPAALAAYEKWMRPLVDDVQKLPPGLEYFAYPRTRLGLAARGVADKLLTSRLFAPVAAKLTQVADTDRQLPEILVREH
ncbi:FAD-dependent monooxygenase [Symbioplanes lichenis]|uniref:FAD-dependent monooxygenase n=1 Tax=Symbioplanes lichenis TaxID=1629072 RepID=UPI0027397025|nr:FAD-dependent monooxygenase [Actinoplanes lichenis]